jgi:hypothetical protein
MTAYEPMEDEFMDLIDRFRAWRREHPDASIRQFSKDFDRRNERKGPPSDGDRVITRGRFQFVVSIEYDENSTTDDTKFYGEFTHERDFPNTLKRRATVRRNEYEYWRPQEGSEVRTVAAFLHEGGMAKAAAYHTALAQAYEQMARLEAYCVGQWHYVGVVVKAYDASDERRDRELAYASLWGIESDSDRAYFNDTIEDLICECESGIADDEMKALKIARASHRVTGIW